MKQPPILACGICTDLLYGLPASAPNTLTQAEIC